MNCPTCAATNDPGLARCAECGRSLPPNCQGCGVPVGEGDELCQRCRTGGARIARPTEPSPAVRLDLRSTFVGRDDTVARLCDLLKEAREKSSLRFVTVTGEAGIGKSRLAEELTIELVVACPEVRTYKGAAVGLGAPPYLAIERMLEDRLGIHEGETPSIARSKILAGVSDVMDGSHATETAHLLGQIMRYPFPDSPYLGRASATQLEMRMFLALRRFLEADLDRHPLAIIFDEMDRAPEETVKVLHYLADGFASRPVLLVALGRPELLRASPQWASGDYAHEEISLQPLSADDSEGLAQRLMLGAKLPETLKDHVRSRLGGNPRAIEETLRFLVESGVAKPSTTEAWTLATKALDAAPMPTTIEEILWARLRVLDPLHRDLLEKAAVVGEVFWLDAVVALTRATATDDDPDAEKVSGNKNPSDQSRAAVAEGLGHLAECEFIHERRITQIPGEREYRFLGPIHALAYQHVPEEQRRRYHRVLAEWHELRGGSGEEAQEDIAKHFERAGELRIAAHRYRRAAEAARARYFNESAMRLYREALRCAGSDGALRIQIWHDFGSVCELVGDYEQAIDAFERVLRLSWVYASRAKGGVALNKIGRIWRRQGDLEKALQYLDRGLELFSQTSDDRGVATSLDDIAWVLWLKGQHEDAYARARQALEIRRNLGDERSIAQSLTNIGNIQKDRGLVAEAKSSHEEALILRRKVGDRYGVALSLNYLGLLMQERRDLAEADRLLEEALAEAEAIGATPLQAMLLTNLGDLAVDRERLVEARRLLDQALKIGRELVSRRVLSAAHRSLAVVELKLENYAQARESCETALRIAERGGIRELEARAVLTLGEIVAAAPPQDPGLDAKEVAQGYMERALTIFREVGHEAALARALKHLGELQIARGQTDAGKAHIEESKTILQRIGAQRDDLVHHVRELATTAS